MEAAERRLAERVIEVGGDPSEPAEPAVAVEAEPAAEEPAGPPQGVGAAAPAPDMPSPARLPQSIAPPVPPADAAMEPGLGAEGMGVDGGMMGALARLTRSMPPDMRKQVDDLLLLYALNGVAASPRPGPSRSSTARCA